jgi:MoxR-like ATPase
MLIGRARETESLLACVAAGRHVLLEGPVGVGKTVLAKDVCATLDRGLVRVDGDGRYTEAKLVGQFDPPAVLATGYRPEHFMPGPLVRAMRDGAVLFVNELNRMPEGVQNVLLPALDEGCVQVPNLGAVTAAPGFTLIATQNPAEFVATGALSEALLDRFELVRLAYQDEAEERQIVARDARCSPDAGVVAAAVQIVRATREDPRIRRGASVRAAIAIADIAARLGGDVARAAELALPTRIELVDPSATPLAGIVDDLKKKILDLR